VLCTAGLACVVASAAPLRAHAAFFADVNFDGAGSPSRTFREIDGFLTSQVQSLHEALGVAEAVLKELSIDPSLTSDSDEAIKKLAEVEEILTSLEKQSAAAGFIGEWSDRWSEEKGEYLQFGQSPESYQKVYATHVERFYRVRDELAKLLNLETSKRSSASRGDYYNIELVDLGISIKTLSATSALLLAETKLAHVGTSWAVSDQEQTDLIVHRELSAAKSSITALQTLAFGAHTDHANLRELKEEAKITHSNLLQRFERAADAYSNLKERRRDASRTPQPKFVPSRRRETHQ